MGMFRKIRRMYWLTTEFLHRHVKLIGRTVLIVLVVSVAAALTIRVVPTPRATVRIGTVGKYTLETIPTSIQSRVSKGLVTIDEDGNAQKALASAWEIQDDGRTYHFTLDDNLNWHDGTKLNGQDINYNFKDVRVERGDTTVTFYLEEPFTPFLHAVAKPVLKNGQYGVGDYSLDKTVVFSGVVQSVRLSGVTEKIIYKFYPTESAALTAFKLGEIDRVENISRIPPEIERESRYEVARNTDLPKITVLFLNNNDQLLKSKPVRQALAYAIKDKSFGNTRAISPISASSWAYNPLVKDYQYDEERAKSLFGQDIEDTGTVSIELKTTLQYLETAEKIATDWRDTLGIQVDVKVVTAITTDYQVLLADYAPPDDPDQYTTWHSTQSTNYTHYTNLRIDKLLEDGRRTADTKLRRDIYQDFQRFLLEDSPAIFLFETNSYNLSRHPLFQ